jgi:hypothetical protein
MMLPVLDTGWILIFAELYNILRNIAVKPNHFMAFLSGCQTCGLQMNASAVKGVLCNIAPISLGMQAA